MRVQIIFSVFGGSKSSFSVVPRRSWKDTSEQLIDLLHVRDINCVAYKQWLLMSSRLNNTESAIFVSCTNSMRPKMSLFSNFVIVSPAGVTCRVVTLNCLPTLHTISLYFLILWNQTALSRYVSQHIVPLHVLLGVS